MEAYTGRFDTRIEFLENELKNTENALKTEKEYYKETCKEYNDFRDMALKQWYAQTHITGCKNCEQKGQREILDVYEDGRNRYIKCSECSQHPFFIEFILDGKMDVEDE